MLMRVKREPYKEGEKMTSPAQPPQAPLFRDPIHDGAADPTVIWNREAKEWWILYTNRRANTDGPKFAWVHGTDIGIASSSDGGAHWNHRGTVQGLEIERGRNTFWAPEVIWHDGLYHMYVSYIQGVPHDWKGHRRSILHYTSANLWDWTYQSRLTLSSDYVIDACVHRMPDGRWRMWYKDEAAGSHTYAADSGDLYRWEPAGPVLTGFGHEGPNVFYWHDCYWMIVDRWRGQAVYRSKDAVQWEYSGMILDAPGRRTDDGTVGLHADVLVQGDRAFIFYFTHPDRAEGVDERSYAFRRSSLQAAELAVRDGRLVCDRDADFDFRLKPDDAAEGGG